MKTFLRLGLLVSLLLVVAPAPALPPNDAVVTFNEIHYNPGGANEDGEFIELVNQMAVRVDIGGWRLAGGVDYVFDKNAVIEGGGRIVIVKTLGAIPDAVGPYTGSLSNSGETIELRDKNNRLMDSLEYGDKGEWPIAPDGSGVTLAKRDPYSSSASPASWTSSEQIGGTPGAANFPPPPSTTTTRVVTQNSTWKYLNTGVAPAANWNNLAFNDTTWSSGPGGFYFGNSTVYQNPPTATAGGIWSTVSWTGDANSEISSTKTYTHKVGLNRPSTFLPINGVTFDSPGSGVTSGANWTLTGPDTRFDNNTVNNLPAGTGSRQLCENFLYTSGNQNAIAHLQLTGLTAGQSYVFTSYVVGYGDPGVRIMQITPSDTGRAFVVDGNAAGNGAGALVKYRYTVPASGSITFDFVPLVGLNSWHHYAFSNEVAPTAPTPELECTGIVLAGYSSELTNGFTRAAANCINGSGLVNGRHGTNPDGSMWLNNGTFTGPNDPYPADITFDLGSLVHLTSFHVWNYNEATQGLMTRGANQVEVSVAQNAAGPFTPAGTLTFFKASGLVSEPGQHFAVDRQNVRYIRFNILNSWNGDNQFAGLSEVKFYKEGSTSATPVPYREKIPTVFNTGLAADGTLLPFGSPDPHYFNVTRNTAAIVESPHPAWLQSDGVSQWTGLIATGASNADPGQFTWRTTFDLTGYTSPTLVFSVAADNSLDNVILNGTPKGINASGFTSYLGPYLLSDPQPGLNTVDFLWTNADVVPNPSGFRVVWDATGIPNLGKTQLPANPVTTYFRQTFNYPGKPGSTYRLLLNYVADDGAVFYLNGSEIFRVNVTGTPTNTTSADTEQLYPMFSGQFEVPAGAVVSGNNVLAVELHQKGAGNADALFLATLDLVEIPSVSTGVAPVLFNEIAGASEGTFFVELRNATSGAQSLTGYRITSSSGATYTLSATSLNVGGLLVLDQTTLGFRPADGDKLFLVTPGQSVPDAVVIKNNPQARDATGRWLRPNASTPGAANTFALNSDIVINEIMYHHHPTYLQTGTTEDPEEWIELYNRGTATVGLAGWKLSGGIDFDFAAGASIPAGGYLVVSNNPSALLTRFPGISVVGPFSRSLSHSEDTIVLEDAAGNPANSVHYYDSGRWSGKADGGGSSLELRNPGMDNSVPEAWAPSDETSRSTWQTYTLPTAVASVTSGASDPTLYNEFILGLLADGECLIDDISVKEVSAGNRELIQNRDFSSGTTATWRNLGNHGSHGRTVVVDDPSSPGNKVMKIVATGATEHMHNHCETTLKDGATFVAINSASSYSVSFRARWLSGSPRLSSRLYFNRLARQTILDVPVRSGTPGSANSRFEANPGPVFRNLSHSPAVPEANTSVTVRVSVADPQGVGAVNLKWRKNGDAGFTTVAMTQSGDFYQAVLPGQAADAIAQFYVEAADTLGAVSTFPSAGPASRALIQWKGATAVPTTAGHLVRLIMLTADSDFLHLNTNVMSNDNIPCTLVYRENEVYYDIGVRIKSSERGRYDDNRLGFAFSFDPTHRFRGTHEGMSMDRSSYGRGTTNSGHGVSDIINWQFFSRAGGIPSMYNDIAYLISPRAAHVGSAQLVMAEFNDAYLDSQFADGASTPTFKLELVYYPTSTTGGPEGLKIPQPDDVRGVTIQGINSTDKESFRWYFLIGNARDNDDYSGVLRLNQTFKLSGTNFATAAPTAVDIDQWLRVAAAMSLAGINDNYHSNSNQHNVKFYTRADGRVICLPWDVDFQNLDSGAALIAQPNITSLFNISESNKRLFYQHLQDIITTSFNRNYLTSWVNLYSAMNTSGGNWDEILAYVDARTATVQSQINSAYPFVPFAITNNAGVDATTATLTGKGWIDVRKIVVQSSGLVLNVTWTTGNDWQVKVPIGPGQNNITLEAFDYQGNSVGQSSIIVTGTSTAIPAAAGNLVISEIHYNPAAPSASEISAGFTDHDDFEFIELKNIGTQTLNLAGCRFVSGITCDLPAITLAANGYAVIARRTAAFNLRHPGVTPITQYYQAGANFLDNGGETIALVGANGADIARLNYGTNGGWPSSPDGTGPSLVLIAPMANPAPADALHWRASTAFDGNPGASDGLALPSDPAGDDDHDGLSNLLEHALGSGQLPVAGREVIGASAFFTFILERQPLAEVNWDLERSTTLPTWALAGANYEVVSRTPIAGGLERVVIRAVNPIANPGSEFLRAKLRVP